MKSNVVQWYGNRCRSTCYECPECKMEISKTWVERGVNLTPEKQELFDKQGYHSGIECQGCRLI